MSYLSETSVCSSFTDEMEHVFVSLSLSFRLEGKWQNGMASISFSRASSTWNGSLLASLLVNWRCIIYGDAFGVIVGLSSTLCEHHPSLDICVTVAMPVCHWNESLTVILRSENEDVALWGERDFGERKMLRTHYRLWLWPDLHLTQ